MTNDIIIKILVLMIVLRSTLQLCLEQLSVCHYKSLHQVRIKNSTIKIIIIIHHLNHHHQQGHRQHLRHCPEDPSATISHPRLLYCPPNVWSLQMEEIPMHPTLLCNTAPSSPTMQYCSSALSSAIMQYCSVQCNTAILKY